MSFHRADPEESELTSPPADAVPGRDPFRYRTGCDKASECVFFLEGNGKFDIKMVEEKRASAKELTSSTRHLTEIQSILRR
jgi:hypothetical protein